MERAHSLLLNEEACSQLGEHQRAAFVFEWLNHLKKLLPAAERDDVRRNQRRLVEQLCGVLIGSPGPPTRWLLAHCLALLYNLGDPVTAALSVDRCNDIIRSRDDSPSGLPTRLAAVACLGAMFQQLGWRLAGSFRDSLTNLLKAMKSAESQGRYEIMKCLEKILRGLGVSAAPCHRDVYKAARTCLVDRSMAVRCAAAECLLELQREAVFLWTSELENVASLCFRAFDGSNPSVRVSVARLLGTLLAAAVEPRQPAASPRQRGRSSLEEAMDLLSGGFLRGGAGFLRASGDLLKGTSSVSKEVRIGVTQACVVFTSLLGGSWLESNFPSFLSLLMDLASHGRATQTAGDAAMTRRCVSFVLRSTLGCLLGEKAQTDAAKHICLAVATQQRAVDSLTEGNMESKSSLDVSASQQLVCCLLELGALIQGLGSTATPLLTDSSPGLLDTVVSVLLHPASSASLAAAWCLRCVAVAMPSQGSPLLDRCTERLVTLKSSPEAVAGYGAAVAALVAAVQHCPLGIPHTKGMLVLGLAEDLLRSASQNSRISLQRTQAGWLLVSSLLTLGPAVVEHHLSRLLLLWRCVFPASLREQEMELRRGDYFTWQVTLEGRAGALCAMKNLLLHCRELVTDDIIGRLLTPLACAVALLTKLPALVRSYSGSVLRWSLVYRLRVYELLALLPPHTYQESFGLVMNQLVWDLSGQDNLNQPCSELLLLPPLCHQDDLQLVGPALHASDHRYIEEQLHSSIVGGASLDNDAFSLCEKSEEAPAPLPPPVALTAAAICLFGALYPHVISAQRVKILETFVETVNQLKGQRQQTVQTHVCAALCSLLKHQGGARGSLGPEEVRPPALVLLLGALEGLSPVLRCLAAEGLARLVQVVGDPVFTVSVSLLCFDRLKTARDAASRSGFALALGALHRYTGGISSPQHLNTCLGVLFTLSQDSTSPEVQTWSLHSLALVVDLSGGLYRTHAEPSFTLVLRLLLAAPPTHPEVHRSLGRCLHALITCLGPDLQGDGAVVSGLRSTCLVACEVMQDSLDSVVQARAISCLQQLHMFSPPHVNLASLVPALCAHLCSSSLCLRRAVGACLRQLAQLEAVEVCVHAVTLVKESPRRERTQLDVTLKEVGLEGALFTLLDRESDPGLRGDIQETLVHMMASSATSGKLGHWLKLCKDVLSATTDCRAPPEARQEDEEAEPARDDDSSVFKAGPESGGPFTALRWATRRFAVECVCRIVAQCETADPAHFDTALAQERRLHESTDFLVLHLGDLVRMAFMAATDHSDQLRLAGLQTLLVIIRRFSAIPEPEFPGHVILEQYQANVGAALRPAFSADAPPDVTAKACQVCSAWIASGVVSDLRDLRRVHQLLASSLAKVQVGGGGSGQLYNEAAATMETLAVLKAWAEVLLVLLVPLVPLVPLAIHCFDRLVRLMCLMPPPPDPPPLLLLLLLLSSSSCSSSSSSSSLSQVYVVAVQRSGQKERPDWTADLSFSSPLANHSSGSESGGAGLLKLVQSDLSTLSHLWLSALQDYGLLSLPQEYASQLPETGGSFYTAETVNQARAHYSSSWAPILHATSLWLHSTGFVMSDDTPVYLSRPATPTSMGNMGGGAKTPEDVNAERLHLILGISVQFLCSPDDQMENITSCLRSLQALLDVAWPRTRIGNDQVLSVELLSVLHRLLVTRESSCVHLAVFDLLRRIITSSQELVRERRYSAEVDDGASEKETLPEFGEGRDTGGLIPGRSLVFGALELCLCVLVRKLPQLSPKLAGTSPTGPGGSVWSLTDSDCQLVASALCVLSELPSICSPEGSVSVLPTVLYLLLGVFREMVLQPSTHTGAPAAGSGPAAVVQSALRALKVVLTSPMSRQEKSRGAWSQLLRAALSSLLGLWDADPGGDHSSLLTALTVFLLSAGPDVCTVEPLPALSLQRFRASMDAKDPLVVGRCHQLLTSLFQAPPTVAVPYIRALGPPLVRFLQKVERSRPQSPEELVGVLEGVRAMEALVQAADPSQRPQLVAVLLPLLISFLLDENALGSAPAASRSLHQAALRDLMRLGPQHSAVFRSLVSSAPPLKSRLEAAVRGNQESLTAKARSSPAKSSPSITLKTHFL
ncbi:HEAT repeat-containing protein 5A isoform X2 [Cyclopterus lumpus]|uniref:HEAT repeat-containing protein 5A isoform X2 n=1 Tax=Cyclopterus lumpus TaxID=8103 RepID=UPI001486CB92|nr:HEAT repeat-containing protein 5A isoform X2 [Cyclopterus lumpus]